ncbi:phosphate uptake regulator PhoU [Candidatus Bathyarchaeota archaeon]|nr:MAG: phosphate uptake regulator PhoU [Candidatus Bathyarchaeota archaeon]
MSVRKIMLLGRSSLVISLPKPWLQLHKLKKGDAVSISMRRDGAMVVYPSVKKGEDRYVQIEVDKNEPKELIARKIIALYLNGYNNIELKSTGVFPPHQQQLIREIARKLYLRIMEASPKHFYFQSYLDESKVSIDLSVRRMHSVAYSMCKDAVTALKENDLELARTIYALDDDVDNFYHFIRKILRSAMLNFSLAETLGVTPLSCLDYKRLVDCIEHTADCASNIVKSVILLNETGYRIPTHTMELLVNFGSTATEIYNEAVNTFFEEDLNKANSIINKCNSLWNISTKISESILKEQEATLVCTICSLREYIDRIIDYSVDIAETAINKSLSYV